MLLSESKIARVLLSKFWVRFVFSRDVGKLLACFWYCLHIILLLVFQFYICVPSYLFECDVVIEFFCK
jgi:hypothetical protein